MPLAKGEERHNALVTALRNMGSRRTNDNIFIREGFLETFADLTILPSYRHDTAILKVRFRGRGSASVSHGGNDEKAPDTSRRAGDKAGSCGLDVVFDRRRASATILAAREKAIRSASVATPRREAANWTCSCPNSVSRWRANQAKLWNRSICASRPSGIR